ncbi:unnamed protein product [Diatraea saccharalis]|uniref:DNA primase large subunit C-terminal domain-containing protein n=1 Tax=Diatraea saccharalis TaxID=40085 RepID=A0A9N9WAU4_9NEOP|nr:unnamed protein product [Diatraea saccharalis]
MSFFYLTAVKGEIPAHLLETIALERLCYLKEVFNMKELCYSEYLVEGGMYDNVGHFLLCVITIICKNIEFKRFIMKTERDLFEQRLNALCVYDLRCFAKKIIRSIKKQQYTAEFIEPLKTLCEHLMLQDLANHVCLESHKRNCNDHHIQLHFKHCLLFVAKREIDLKNGTAFIPCGKWKQFLIILFSINLSYKLEKSNVEALEFDPRISDLLNKLKSHIDPLLSNNHNNNYLLNSKRVDKESKNFPPCMLNIHEKLRKQHRLPHTERFYYTLFLKDIGMPVDQAIDFWRFEYRQAPNGIHSCCHNWEKNEKKFVYGIRHMYGLEGCRRNYTSMNCQRIQSFDSSCTSGGCPFKTFDHTKMLSILNMDSNESLWSQLYELKSRHNYTGACIKYMQSRNLVVIKNCDIDNASFNFTPVKYYKHVSLKTHDVI